MLNNEMISHIIKNKKLTPYTYKLFIYFLSNIDSNYRIKGFLQKEIAENACVSRSNVSSGLKQLVESNILIKDSKDYYFNKDLFTK